MENTQKTEKKTTKPKNKGGRPSKYHKKYVKLLLEYINKEPFETKVVEGINGFGLPFKKTVIVPNQLPTIEAFSIKHNLAEDTLLDWAQATTKTGKPKYPEFSAAYKKLKSVQKNFLVVNGLTGLYKEKFSIFVAQNFTPMRDKIEHSGDQGKPMLIKITDFSNATDLSKRRNPPAV